MKMQTMQVLNFREAKAENSEYCELQNPYYLGKKRKRKNNIFNKKIQTVFNIDYWEIFLCIIPISRK